MKDWEHQVLALAALAPRVPASSLKDVMNDVARAALAGPSVRQPSIETLARVMSGLVQSGVCIPYIYGLWNQSVLCASEKTRQGLLQDIVRLAPTLTALGGVEGLRETVDAIRCVGMWWD